ncbi:hypothetical protein Cgig2_022764 [Carnegiea gigantea]|uniref:UBX domain-containing protein n=1 Tax=Carnegiea gigantea TaxID=171969 RepID=A0A9Q1QFW6_9CARY|nr:hypothetical protein Cgig2_022764 [Carnegiea gigantea]
MPPMLCKVDGKKEGMGTNPTVRQLGQCLKLQKGKYGRAIRVFQISKASQSPPEMANSEESDEFFELTLDNCYHLMATKKEGKYLKTRKIREGEEAARRAKMTKAVIRVRFPDNHVLEAVFHPSEPMQKVFDLLSKVLARPELPYYLYTTPPKKQIKGISQNIFAAGLFLVQLCISHITYQKRMKLIQVPSLKKM